MTLDDLASPVWWTTAVIGSVAIKIVADYVRTGITKLALKGYAAWSSRSALAKADYDKRIEELRESSVLRELYFQREVRARHRASFFMTGALFSGLLVTLIRMQYKLAALPSAPSPYVIIHMDAKYMIPIFMIGGMYLFALSASAYARAGFIGAMLEEAITPTETATHQGLKQQ
ncbi:hypothetical protein [Burkholderia sp. MSMB1078WGS]|uniref:hypothetical protein n=1 Tax=Burkholderia sp. MSMB1078WGS TaxID=1637900 RepID=UPI00075F4297|nr:hypothetical protein [Burkholderia sp. MSMB1078WGS]